MQSCLWCSLVCTFVVREPQRQDFSRRGPYYLHWKYKIRVKLYFYYGKKIILFNWASFHWWPYFWNFLTFLVVLLLFLKLRLLIPGFFFFIWFFTPQSTIFQSCWDESIWVEPVLNKDKCVLLKDTTQWRRWGSNPRLHSLEASTLPLSHCAPTPLYQEAYSNNNNSNN